MNDPLDSNRDKDRPPPVLPAGIGEIRIMPNLLQTPTGGIIGCRVCPICGQEYFPTSPSQKYCLGCRKEGKRRVHRLWKKGWGQEKKDIKKMANKQWKKDNPVKAKKWDREHPDMVRAERRQTKAKRRILGFAPMNQPFDNCEGHHLNQTDVVYIPKDLHRSIPHNVFTGKNMERINALACAWVTEDYTEGE
jgi:hypothetical protein